MSGLELLATAVVLLNDGLEVSYANPAAENLLELSRRQLVGSSIRTLFGEAPALLHAIDKTLSNGASYTEQELERLERGPERGATLVKGGRCGVSRPCAGSNA